LTPTKNDEPSCVTQTVGIALDGVQIWNQYAPENLADTKLDNVPSDLAIGVDAGRGFFAEPMDPCSGHPGPNQAYHYHKLPAHGLGFDSICFADEQEGKPSGLLGVAVDGFPLYGPFDADGNELTPADLDECNGMEVEGEYRYIVTQDFPYGPGCLWGTPAEGHTDTGLCWFAKDWLDAMETTEQEYYRDCQDLPLKESTGTEGCVSYYSNPKLYEETFGDLTGWESKYDETCGNKDWLQAFKAANPSILGAPPDNTNDVGVYYGAAIGCLAVVGFFFVKGFRRQRSHDGQTDYVSYERV
jgi:hypothetical protein